ncbi:MAG: SAM-dependent methyltransferase [Clostridia bacterium]|nr:SAM-dependent methyltransferase [Clostridia bacterium]
MIQRLLPPRLEAAVSFVRPHSVTADVGTDHGLLATALIQRGICPHVWASDLRKGPLSRAQKRVEELGLQQQIDLCLCPGLEKLPLEDIGDVVIAGMGPEVIASILQDALPGLTSRHRLILQPMAKPEILRLWLAEHGFRLVAERLCRDSGKLYAVLVAEPGQMPIPSAAECLTGILTQGDPLLKDWCAKESARLRREAAGLEKGGLTEKAAQLRALAQTVEAKGEAAR